MSSVFTIRYGVYGLLCLVFAMSRVCYVYLWSVYSFFCLGLVMAPITLNTNSILYVCKHECVSVFMFVFGLGAIICKLEK